MNRPDDLLCLLARSQAIFLLGKADGVAYRGDAAGGEALIQVLKRKHRIKVDPGSYLDAFFQHVRVEIDEPGQNDPSANIDRYF
jgi:hypothetical protein